MISRVVILLLCFNLSNKFVIGRRGTLEKVDKKAAKIRPAIKTIQTKDGDIFECIDIKSQPAFDHPLLKNHTIQMTPSFYPPDTNITSPDLEADVERLACPQGTIPIWKHNEIDYSSMFASSRYHGRDLPQNVTDEAPAKLVLAAVEMDGIKFHGTRATINIWQPTVFNLHHISGASLLILSEDGGKQRYIEAGWYVFLEPESNRPTRLHIFGYDSDTKVGCLDLTCNFVQVSSSVALGSILRPVSTYNGEQYVLTLIVYKDPKTQNWLLVFGSQNILVGYWPATIFPSEVSFVSWRGGVVTPSDVDSPDMGSGHPPNEGYGKGAFFQHINLLNEYDNFVVPNLKDCVVTIGDRDCYAVDLIETEQGGGGIGFYFGGKGGC